MKMSLRRWSWLPSLDRGFLTGNVSACFEMNPIVVYGDQRVVIGLPRGHAYYIRQSFDRDVADAFLEGSDLIVETFPTVPICTVIEVENIGTGRIIRIPLVLWPV